MILGVVQRTKPTSVAYGHFDGGILKRPSLLSYPGKLRDGRI